MSPPRPAEPVVPLSQAGRSFGTVSGPAGGGRAMTTQPPARRDAFALAAAADVSPAPSVALRFASGSATHVGLVRSNNEDCCAVMPERGLWAVADGMGGHAAGEVASRLVIDALAAVGPATGIADRRAQVIDAVAFAHRRILSHGALYGLPMMGATVAVLVIHGHVVNCVWAGDSRIYRLRNGRLQALTRDHSEVALMMDRGLLTPDEARRSPRRHVITRAVGIALDPLPETISDDARPGDRLLVCSDGLTEHLPDARIAAVLSAAPDAQAAADALVAQTLDDGASDNVTVVVVDCLAGGER